MYRCKVCLLHIFYCYKLGDIWEKVHQPVTLNQLVDILKNKRDKLNEEVYSQEEDLSKLIKYSTKVLSEYETKTEEMVLQLHATRDEQV